jgi:flagellar hook-basal body complex protein FliE
MVNFTDVGSIDKLTSVTSGAGQVNSRSAAAAELQSSQEMNKLGAPVEEPAEGTTFSDVLRNSVSQVNEYQADADVAIKELVAGRTKNIHETMLTIERADASLKMMMQVRNKILEAYKEIMRMQV